MFKLSRRRDHSLQPLTKETADRNATTAAASAFMRGNPAPSLSSAAAAAALRAQPSAPTNVAEISSKRTQRRTSSLSSPASRDRGKKSKQQRSPSVSSMSERTFRSPSPGRTPLRKQDVPPIPSISASKTAAIPLQTQNFQTASQKSEGHQQGSWFGAATAQHAYQEKRTESMSKLTPDLPESRSGSVSSSINFSYPRARITSYDSHMTSEHDLVYDPNSRRMVSKDVLVPASHEIEGTALKATEKAKGTKLAKQGHMTQGPNDAIKLMTRNDIQPEPLLKTIGQSHAAGASFGRGIPNDSSSFNPAVPTTATEKLPQEREFEVENPRDGQNHNASQHEAPGVLIEPNLTHSLTKWDSTKSEIPFAYAGSGSETSVRSAHFASSTDHLVVKHEPPPRSLSPRKSALKSAISSRGNQSSQPNENIEYLILGTSHPSKEDPTPSQRKSARVSWNDNSTVVIAELGKFEEADFAAGHGVQSRQNGQSAFEGLKANKTSSLQEDELMSPRPALPLFGSVRDKKGKEPEERQLVRPRERSLSPQPLPPSNFHTSPSTPKNEILSPIESVKALQYSREQSPRNVANISKYREPLPAIIASTESLGQESEDMYSSGDERFEDVSTGTEQSMIQRPRDISDSSPISEYPNEASKVNSKTLDGPIRVSNSDTYPLVIHQDVAPMTEPSSLPGSFPLDEDVSRFHMDDASESITPVLAQASGYKTGNQDHPADDDKEEEKSDMDSIYSDAYEDLPEAVDGGFMSLDATLVSSPLASAGGNRVNLDASHEGKPSDDASNASFQSSDDWERTKAYWKSLTSEERRQLEMEALQEADDDDAKRERLPAKGIKTLPDTSGYPLNSEQRSQLRQSQQEHPLGADLTSLGETRQHSIAFQTPVSGRANFRPGISADGPRNQSKNNSTMEMEEEPIKHTNFAMTDAQRGRGSLQQSTTTARTGMTVGRRLQKLAQPKRSTGSGQRHIDDEIRGSITRPKSYNPLSSTAFSPRRQQEHQAHSPSTEPAMNTAMRSTLRRRGSDSSESSFIRSRSIGSPRRGLRVSMRSNSSESKISLAGNKGRKRLTLRSLSPTTPHTKHHSITPVAPSRPLVENQRHQPFRSNSVAPRINQSISRKDEDSAYGDHISDSSDDDMNTTPLTNGSITGDEYEPVHSRLKHSILHMYARNSPPDQNSSANAGFFSVSPKHDALKLRGDHFYDEENAHMPLDQPSGHPSTALPISASPRRQGLISTLRRKRDGHVRESREVNDILQHSTDDAVSARNNGIPNQASGWPLQNKNDETNEGSMTSPPGDTGRRSAASGSIVKDDLTSEPRQQHELQLYGDSSDPNHANAFLSQEPKRKKFTSLRKMFKINN